MPHTREFVDLKAGIIQYEKKDLLYTFTRFVPYQTIMQLAGNMYNFPKQPQFIQKLGFIIY